MAHIILSIPVEFSCALPQFSWETGSAVVRKRHQGYGEDAVLIELLDTAAAGFVQAYPVEDLPPELRAALPPVGTRAPRSLQSTTFPVLVAVQKEKRSRTALHDPWAIRAHYFEAEPTAEEALKLLRKFGPWNRRFLSDVAYGKTDGPMVRLVDFRHVWSGRQAIADASVSGPKAWFEFDRRGDFHSRAAFPHFFRKDVTCEDAVLTSITVDFLKELRFGLCARKDCNRPFAVQRKGKKFCTQYCAHIVSVRAGRQRAKSGDSARSLKRI